MTVLAFDLGGTRLKAGLVDGEGVRSLRAVDVSGASADEALDRLVSVGRELEGAEACGLAVPGLVDEGRIVSLPGKLEGIVGRDLRAVLRERLGLRTAVLNDAVAYGIGEATAGAGRGFRRVVVVTIGTGVGVTVVQDGRPATPGPLGAGLLGGFIPIGDGGRDTAGGAGTIEALCRAERLEDTPIGTYRANLARALVALANAHGPEAIVVGGGPSARPELLDGVEDAVNGALWEGFSVRVLRAALGDGAALVGAAHAAREAVP